MKQRYLEKRQQDSYKTRLIHIKWFIKLTNKKITLSNTIKFYNARKNVFDLFDDFTSVMPEGKYGGKGEGLKILTPKQVRQKLPTVLAEIKAGNTSDNLLSEIRQIAYSLYRGKEITKKVYNNLIKSKQI